jgi:hypothetical protein
MDKKIPGGLNRPPGEFPGDVFDEPDGPVLSGDVEELDLKALPETLPEPLDFEPIVFVFRVDVTDGFGVSG